MAKKEDQTTLREKLDKLYPEFSGSVDGMTVEQMEKRITKYQKELEESEQHKEENTALNNARELVSELSGPYNDVKKAVKLKTKFLIQEIKSKGGQ